MEIRKELNCDYFICPICREIFFSAKIAANHAEKAHGAPVKIILLSACGVFVLSHEEIRRGAPFEGYIRHYQGTS